MHHVKCTSVTKAINKDVSMYGGDGPTMSGLWDPISGLWGQISGLWGQISGLVVLGGGEDGRKTLVLYRIPFLSLLPPCFPFLEFTIKQSRATDTADLMLRPAWATCFNIDILDLQEWHLPQIWPRPQQRVSLHHPNRQFPHPTPASTTSLLLLSLLSSLLWSSLL